jgi:hypothetical protein
MTFAASAPRRQPFRCRERGCLWLLHESPEPCRSLDFSRKTSRGPPPFSLLRLGGAFRDVRLARDHLQVLDAPEPEQMGPGGVAILAPDSIQGDPVIDLARSEQPSSAFGTSSALHLPERPHEQIRSGPELPGDDAGGVPHRVGVRLPVAPEILVPAEAEDRLPANAAMAVAARECRLAIRSGRRAEAFGNALGPIAINPPSPALRSAAVGRKRPREAIGSDGMGAPIPVNRQAWRCRHEPTGQGVHKDGCGEDVGQAPSQPQSSFAVCRPPGWRRHSRAGEPVRMPAGTAGALRRFRTRRQRFRARARSLGRAQR